MFLPCDLFWTSDAYFSYLQLTTIKIRLLFYLKYFDTWLLDWKDKHIFHNAYLVTSLPIIDSDMFPKQAVCTFRNLLFFHLPFYCPESCEGNVDCRWWFLHFKCYTILKDNKYLPIRHLLIMKNHSKINTL